MPTNQDHDETIETRIVVTPTGLLAHRPSDGERSKMEDLAWDRHELTHVTPTRLEDVSGRREDCMDFLVDSPEVRAIARDVLGRELDELIIIHADYPFDWRHHKARELDDILPQLPGYIAGSHSFFSLETDPYTEARPPFLTLVMEDIGVGIAGVLSRDDWKRWQTAFEARTRHFAMRRG